MDVHAKLADLRRVVEEARSMPMSASAVVNRAELLAQLDELEAAIGESLTEAGRVVAERDAILAEARDRAGQIVAEAHQQRELIVSDTEVFRVAKRQADEALEDARTEADALRRETDDYVDGTLATFEITLERTMDAVRRGRERLAGRSPLDSLTAAEADRIKLPEHLEG